jgi:hypothetical protein
MNLSSLGIMVAKVRIIVYRDRASRKGKYPRGVDLIVPQQATIAAPPQ